jgi:glutaredoxin
MIKIYGLPTCASCKDAVRLCEELKLPYQYFCASDGGVMEEMQEILGHRPTHVPLIVDGSVHWNDFNSFKNDVS